MRHRGCGRRRMEPLSAWPVSSRVNSPKINEADLLLPVPMENPA